MQNEIEQAAVEEMMANGFTLHGALWARSINSPTWAYYMTLVANKEAALCV